MTAWLATWRHRHEDGPRKGELVIPIRGALVLEYAHNPAQGFVALLLLGDGTTREEQVKNLLIQPSDEHSKRSSDDARAEVTDLGDVLIRLGWFDSGCDSDVVGVACRVLERLTNEHAPLLDLRARMVELELIDPIPIDEAEAAEAPTDAAKRLLSELVEAIKQADADRMLTQAERNIAIEERDVALARADELSKELEAALAKKRGKKADAPSGAARE